MQFALMQKNREDQKERHWVSVDLQKADGVQRGVAWESGLAEK